MEFVSIGVNIATARHCPPSPISVNCIFLITNYATARLRCKWLVKRLRRQTFFCIPESSHPAEGRDPVYGNAVNLPRREFGVALRRYAQTLCLAVALAQADGSRPSAG